jgi:transcriptional regulator with XRE-family HTH domain
LKEIGEYLRKAREERNISLKDVQETTKISLRYLEAIDCGDFNGIPGEVYRKGFIANYAGAIGLDPQEVLQRYHQIKFEQEEQERQIQLEQAVFEKYHPTVSLRWSREVYLTIAASLIGLLVVFSFLFPSVKHSYIDEVFSSRTNQESKPVNGSSATLPYPITVYATFTKKVWVLVKYDYTNYLYTTEGATFGPSTPKLLWTAQKELEIQIGDPSGIRLNFNNSNLARFGEAGKRIVLKFSPKGLITP